MTPLECMKFDVYAMACLQGWRIKAREIKRPIPEFYTAAERNHIRLMRQMELASYRRETLQYYGWTRDMVRRTN